jgi:hypothetical protein
VNEKNRARLIELTTPLLGEGERVELTCTSNIGTVSVKRQVATAAAVAVLSAGTLMAAVRPKTRYVVLTDRRLLLFDMAPSGRPAAPLVAQLARSALSSSNFKTSVRVTFDLLIDGQDKAIRMMFPLPGRSDARQLADALAR